ncbi:hypothetical protein KDJ56_22050 (plasmid) [Brevibacillus composti]|uniref:Uncharacterized protein n=1 Tax=Brevibacillus composti TaxID=2796470 RepID=A0A7T5JR63_9BACL|nr:hypothetical protein [Brevibacillus composti]QQE76756.1 hypothetical protein JD108_22160 [Brevibacillus composti]QUO43824.1 hypothetical protein KDJ56_22050 [Brevibacillus composti]
MARKSETERLQEIEQKIVQLRAQKQQIETRVKQKERKERTRKLIQIGAIFEKWCDIQSVEEAELVAKSISEKVKEQMPKLRLQIQSKN